MSRISCLMSDWPVTANVNLSFIEVTFCGYACAFRKFGRSCLDPVGEACRAAQHVNRWGRALMRARV